MVNGRNEGGGQSGERAISIGAMRRVTVNRNSGTCTRSRESLL